MPIKYLLHNTKCCTHKYPCTPSKVQPKFLSFPGGASGKECTCQCRRQKRHRFDPWVESHMDGGAWQAAVYGVAKSRTQLSDFTFTFHFHALEKEIATHSSIITWRIPAIAEPGGLPSMGSHRVGHN